MCRWANWLVRYLRCNQCICHWSRRWHELICLDWVTNIHIRVCNSRSALPFWCWFSRYSTSVSHLLVARSLEVELSYQTFTSTIRHFFRHSLFRDHRLLVEFDTWHFGWASLWCCLCPPWNTREHLRWLSCLRFWHEDFFVWVLRAVEGTASNTRSWCTLVWIVSHAYLVRTHRVWLLR